MTQGKVLNKNSFLSTVFNYPKQINNSITPLNCVETRERKFTYSRKSHIKSMPPLFDLEFHYLNILLCGFAQHESCFIRKKTKKKINLKKLYYFYCY